MTKAARIQNGIVAEVVTLVPGVVLADSYHPEIGFIESGDDVTQGMIYVAKSKQFCPAPAPSLDVDAIKAAYKMRVVSLLSDSAWTQATDEPDSVKAPWAAYRKALRALTFDDVEHVSWPSAPAVS